MLHSALCLNPLILQGVNLQGKGETTKEGSGSKGSRFMIALLFPT